MDQGAEDAWANLAAAASAYRAVSAQALRAAARRVCPREPLISTARSVLRSWAEEAHVEGSKKTILVPIDFQDASHEALALARELGARLGMEIVLLHVFSIPVVVYPGFEPILAPGLPQDIAIVAQQALDALARSAGSPQTMLASGDPAAEILKVIETTRPAFVIMGTHGRKGLSHLFMGSVAEHVIRASSSPVITVHAPPGKKA
jgi:nucleotide-binding universal stress UspA family protein